jgi:hypothetical protein
MERARALRSDALEPAEPEEKWRSILEDDALWSLDARAAFERELFDWLTQSKVSLDGEMVGTPVTR